MKRIIIGGLAAGLLASAPALAADIPLKAPPKGEVPYTWTGSYVGGFVGGAWSHIDSYQADANNAVFALGRVYAPQNASSWIGGVNTGYNWQIGQVVLGVESTLSGTRLISNTADVGDLNAARTGFRMSKIGWITTTAARLGFATGNWLLYGKGGGAWAQRDADVTTFNTTTGAANSSRVASDWLRGWTAGAGAEWALTQNISFKLEYDYLKLNNKISSNISVNCNGVAACATAAIGDISLIGVGGNIQMVVAGVNVRFNTFGPVVAKY